MAEIADLAKAALRAWRPPEKLSLSEWADKHFVLSAESSAEAGRWHTLPYQKGIMDAVTDPTVEQISVMKSARVGYSKILNACIAFHIHQDPCPMMLVQPTIEDAQGFSKEEIAPMLRDVPVLRGLVSESKAKDGANTILQKQYPGGTLGLVGANSPRGFRRVSRRIVMFDETDGYPPSAGAEGDQIKLGIRRTEYYWNRKIIAGSTPTLKDASRIERLFAQGDQRRYFVPCPDCGHMQFLKWSGMQWHEPTDPVHYLCEDCGVLIPHSKKRWMVERGEWRPTAPGNGKHVSFHIWAAYSYSPNASWNNLRDEFLEAKNDAEALKTFVNTVLGESWEDDYAAKVGADSLLERAEAYEPQIIPAEASALTIGCDVQGNRLSLSVWAWGREEEGWLIDRVVIHGDPSRPEPWKQLDEIVSRPFPHALGCELRPDVVCIDSGGHHTMEVYQYARERQNLGVIAVKGQSHKGRPPIGKPTKVDLNCKGRALKKGAEVFPVGSDTIKSLLFGRLKHNEVGPGYLHFYAKVGLEYFEELTAEKQITRFVRGYPERVWVKKSSQHNEALDELVYAYAALNRMYQRYDRRTMWDQLEKRLEKSAESESKAPLRSNKAPKRSFVRQW